MITYFIDLLLQTEILSRSNLLDLERMKCETRILLQLKEMILWFRVVCDIRVFLQISVQKNPKNLPTLKSCKFLITSANQF